MSSTLAELTGFRAALAAAQFSGIQTVTYEGRTVSYRSQRELDRAIQRLDNQIAQLSGTTTIKSIVVRDCKGT